MYLVAKAAEHRVVTSVAHKSVIEIGTHKPVITIKDVGLEIGPFRVEHFLKGLRKPIDADHTCIATGEIVDNAVDDPCCYVVQRLTAIVCAPDFEVIGVSSWQAVFRCKVELVVAAGALACSPVVQELFAAALARVVNASLVFVIAGGIKLHILFGQDKQTQRFGVHGLITEGEVFNAFKAIRITRVLHQNVIRVVKVKGRIIAREIITHGVDAAAAKDQIVA